MNRSEDLNRLYHRFNDRTWLELDPLGLIDPTLNAADFELLSFLVAGLSYGRVEQIRKSCFDLIKRLSSLGVEKNGAGLAAFLRDTSPSTQNEISKALEGWKHRLNTSKDLSLVLLTLSKALERRGSLCQVFQNAYQVEPKDHIEAFCNELLNLSGDTRVRKKSEWSGTGLSWFLSSPADGSTCKRLLMWLRWMIRFDEIDPGIWQKEEMLDSFLPQPSASRLFYPLDAHVFKYCVQNEIIPAVKTPTWKTVELVTKAFREIEPDDPVRFDFAICHLGMVDFRKLGENLSL